MKSPLDDVKEYRKIYKKIDEFGQSYFNDMERPVGCLDNSWEIS